MATTREWFTTLPAGARPVVVNRHDRRRRDIGVGDVMAAALLSTATVAGNLLSGNDGKADHTGAVAILLTVLMVAPVALARRLPISMAATFAAAGLASWLFVGLGSRCGVTLPAAFWITCSIGLRARGRRAAVGVALVIVGICAMGRVDDSMDFSSAFVMMAPISIGFWFAGRTIRQRADTIRQVQEQNAEIAATRARRAELAVEADRAEVISSLDDLVHDRLSGMAAAADTGRQHIDEPHAAQQALATIASDGRDTLARMREAVGSLRSDAPLHPQPDLAQMAGLVEGSGGRLLVEGAPRPLPSGVELSGYRIVEQLVRSASRPEVRIRFGADELELRVTVAATTAADDARELVAPALTERAAMHGGSLTASRVEDRLQWVARLPVAARPA